MFSGQPDADPDVSAYLRDLCGFRGVEDAAHTVASP
jgi:hypothetical protein